MQRLWISTRSPSKFSFTTCFALSLSFILPTSCTATSSLQTSWLGQICQSSSATSDFRGALPKKLLRSVKQNLQKMVLQRGDSQSMSAQDTIDLLRLFCLKRTTTPRLTCGESAASSLSSWSAQESTNLWSKMRVPASCSREIAAILWALLLRKKTRLWKLGRVINSDKSLPSWGSRAKRTRPSQLPTHPTCSTLCRKWTRSTSVVSSWCQQNQWLRSWKVCLSSVLPPGYQLERF